MMQKIGTKGQVVIPRELRDQAGLEPGAEVSIEPTDDGVVVRRAGPRHSDLRGRFAGSGMAGRLLDDRRREPR
jgi:AbrB family looped-hinge helix DNA binding protein